MVDDRQAERRLARASFTGIEIPVSISIDGDVATSHRFQAYDGYTALAGLSWSLSLLANYVETGKVRRRGDFDGRGAVFARPLKEGSVAVDLMVSLANSTGTVPTAVIAGLTTAFFYDVLKRTIDRNLGIESQPTTPRLRALVEQKGGEVEALIAANEPALKQAHSIIGYGANIVNINGGPQILGTFDSVSKEYIDQDVLDDSIKIQDVSVASFNANSGHGSAFDFELGRVIPFKMRSDTLAKVKGVLSWGLYEYSRGTKKKITLKFMRVVALDGRVKKYIVLDATRIDEKL